MRQTLRVWWPVAEHEETDDEAPPQWDEQPAREGGHPH